MHDAIFRRISLFLLACLSLPLTLAAQAPAPAPV